jgi:hypothetical protein
MAENLPLKQGAMVRTGWNCAKRGGKFINKR